LSFLKRLTEPRLAGRFLFTLLLLVLLVIAVFSLGGIFSGGKSLVINEIMASNRVTIADEDGDYPDWIEIYNRSSKAVNLHGYWVSNDRETPFMWRLPDIYIAAGEHLVIFASGKDLFNADSGEMHTSFRLGASGGELYLVDPEASILDSITYPEMLSNVSYGRTIDDSNSWSFFLEASPGAANKATAYEQVADMPRAEEQNLLINEILTDNRTSLADEDGDLEDWIEIYNPGPAPINLENYWLSDKIDNPFKWRFPAVTIEPNGYLVLFASGKNRSNPEGAYLHTNFSLNDRDDTLVLSMSDGTVIDILEIRNMQRDVSFGRGEEDREKWLYFPRPTPGEANFSAGFEQFSGSPVPELQISEVMAVNVATIADEEGDYEDWIEIFSPESYSINLEGYGLSDREEEPYRWQFPPVTIAPGERLVVFASGKDRFDPESGTLHTNFKLKASGETVVLYHPSGILVDRMATGALSPGISAGRLYSTSDERYFFTSPNPGGEPESEYFSRYSFPLQINPAGGFYDRPVTVTITSADPNAAIRYTTDGSEPNENSLLYSEPVTFNSTTVLRTRTFEDNQLPGPVENRSYFIGQDHKLTVVSLMLDPRDLWDPIEGIYVKGYGAIERFPYYGANFWKDMEKPVHLELYEPDGKLGLSLDAGLKIGGQFSRGMDQKIFNIFARNIYGFNEINYPLFPNKELSTFKAITLRTSGQDSVYSKIRDIVMTSLLEDTNVDYQDYRQAVLYLNGEYWGIYNIRERINSYFIAGNHNLHPENIDLLQANWVVREGSNEDYLDMLEFVRSNDMALDENYSYIKTRMDVNSYIDALIVQIYFAQTDQGNIRYWREQDSGGRWRWIIFDLDWGMWLDHVNHNILASMTNPAGTGAWGNISTTLTVSLLQNEDFKRAFIERFAYHLEYTFAPERVIGRIDELASNIEDEMPRQIERWGGSMGRWEQEIESMREFARLRPAVVIEHIRRKFNLNEEEMQIFY